MRICAILVLYNPDILLLKKVFGSIITQVSHTVILDNSDSEQNNIVIFTSDINKFTYIPLGTNRGIAYAQNRGIEFAKINGYDFVVFFDQDSTPQHSFIDSILQARHKLSTSHKIGAIGPAPYSRSTNKEYKAKFAKGVKINDGTVREIDQIISSGSVISIDVFSEVGLFKEEMFIDIVDFEWCWRAKEKGYKHFIATDVHLQHMFGTKEWRVLGFRITVPSSFRIYYQFRNYLWLIPLPYVSTYWKLSNGVKLLIKFFLLPLIGKNGEKYIYNSIRGIKDGIFNRKVS